MKKLGVVILLILIAAVATISAHPEWIRIDHFEIEQVESSNEDLLFQRIRASLAAQMHVYEGRFFWEIPLEKVFAMATADKRVKKVSVYREFPSKVRLVIEPHTPVLSYLGRDGRIYPVARDATLLPAVAPNEAPDLPLLRGEELRDEPGLRERAIELLGSIPDDGGPLRKKTVSEILFTPKDGFKIFVSGFGSEVKMGDTDFGPKVSRVQKVLSYLDSQNIKGRVIDARFSKKVVVRVRKAP